MEIGDPFTKDELITAFSKANKDISRYFSSIALAQFFTAPANKWSPAANLDHLIKSITPVTIALRLPTFLLAILFGKATVSSKRVGEVKQIYLGKLAEGAKASRAFTPKNNKNLSDPAKGKELLITEWNKATEKLMLSFSQWNEDELEKIRLPHPILGKLTVREMMLFTLYHYSHHLNNVEKLLKEKS
ncbi:MAG: DinB family protein [Blastocatellia bacterium]